MSYNIRLKNDNYLCHKSHKYIDKEWSHGRWNYIYEVAKDKLGISAKERYEQAKEAHMNSENELREKSQKSEASRDRYLERRNEYNNHMGPVTKEQSKAHTTALNIAKQQWQKSHDDYERSQNNNAKAYENRKQAEAAYKNSLAGKADKAAESMKEAAKKGKEIVNKVLALPFMASFVVRYTHKKNHPN